MAIHYDMARYPLKIKKEEEENENPTHQMRTRKWNPFIRPSEE